MNLIKILFRSYFYFILIIYFPRRCHYLQLKDGIVKIKTFEDKAPKHVKQIKELVQNGKYDGVVFHRVILNW